MSTSPITTTPLADVFTDCVIHLWGCSEDEQRRLTRYIVAYPLLVIAVFYQYTAMCQLYPTSRMCICYPCYNMRHNKDTMKVNIIVIYLPLVHLCYVGRSVMEYITS